MKSSLIKGVCVDGINPMAKQGRAKILAKEAPYSAYLCLSLPDLAEQYQNHRSCQNFPFRNIRTVPSIIPPQYIFFEIWRIVWTLMREVLGAETIPTPSRFAKYCAAAARVKGKSYPFNSKPSSLQYFKMIAQKPVMPRLHVRADSNFTASVTSLDDPVALIKKNSATLGTLKIIKILGPLLIPVMCIPDDFLQIQNFLSLNPSVNALEE